MTGTFAMIPEAGWEQVEEAAAVYWDKISKKSECSAKVVQILKDYSAVMNKAGNPYRCN